MTQKILLPRLVGTRATADKLVDDLPNDAHVDSVLLMGRALSTATDSFTDELVLALQKRGTAEIVLLAAPSEFQKQVKEAAARHGGIRVRVGQRGDLALT